MSRAGQTNTGTLRQSSNPKESSRQILESEQYTEYVLPAGSVKLRPAEHRVRRAEMPAELLWNMHHEFASPNRRGRAVRSRGPTRTESGRSQTEFCNVCGLEITRDVDGRWQHIGVSLLHPASPLRPVRSGETFATSGRGPTKSRPGFMPSQ